jgi:dimethylamine/trimethylamine dehydrogenase
LWRDQDIPIQAKMVDQCHQYGALVGAELGHVGLAAGNRSSRTRPLGPSSHLTFESLEPFQCKAMDKRDIKEVRDQHKAAAIRAKKAGFDIVYVYAAHNLSLASHFLSRRYNQRSDEYGGSLENRARLLKELLEDTKEVVGDTCGIAVRFAVDDMVGEDGMTHDGEGKEVVEMLKDIPDLWDVNVADWTNDSATSRFANEGFQEEFTKFVKQVTDKPVVGVGRFTSPDTMVSQIKRGVIDFIGAARPSIADPFLPKKIEEGRSEDIRECIGCNICVSGEWSYSPIRCTQNPTMMEEGRRNWHPEIIAPKGSDDNILIVGAGPAGLECALALGNRGYEVILAEKLSVLGGRVQKESALPGLAEWARVQDYREHLLQQKVNVSMYLESELDADQIIDFDANRIVIATGAHWRRDAVGRANYWPVEGTDKPHVFTPDDAMNGVNIEGPVVIYDTDGGYIGNAIAEKLRAEGKEVSYVTSAAEPAGFLFLTMEQHKVIHRLMEIGVPIERLKVLSEVRDDSAVFDCAYGGKGLEIEAKSVVIVTGRLPIDELFHSLENKVAELDSCSKIRAVDRIGDCEAPSIIATAVYEGHKYARNLDAEPDVYIPYLPEMNQAM